MIAFTPKRFEKLKTESESATESAILGVVSDTMTMTDTRGQSKRMTEWHTSRISKAKSISMRRGGKGKEWR